LINVYYQVCITEQILKNVWEVCKFADEVVSGELEIGKFAVELYSILGGKADKSYQDPETFLDNTYVTDAIRLILRDSLLRLAENKGKAVDLLDVSFGGGKTHSVVLLYHVFKNPELGTRFIRESGISKDYGIDTIPDTKVIAIDCREVKRNTLWGEIADRAGMFEDFENMDKNKRSPNEITKIQTLFEKPTLLMLDEVPHYLLKLKSNDIALYKSTLLFLNELVSAANRTDKTRFIITTTQDQKLLRDMTEEVKEITGTGAYEVTEDLKEAVSRGADPIVPVKEKDAYGVICKRLVKKIDEKARDEAVEEYYNYYMEKGLITEENYREKLKKAYPFHPFFIETLYNRVGSIQEFNKTRGMFRLLGLVLNQILDKKEPCTLVGTGDLHLDTQHIMDDLTSKVHKDFFNIVIESDCIDKARKIDSTRGGHTAEKIASTIYLYSLIGTTNITGIRLQDVQLAVGVPGLDPGLIDNILHEDVEKEFWYIKNKHGEFYFDKDPNINQIISNYKTNVKPDVILSTIRNMLARVVPSKTSIKPVIWDDRKLDEDDIVRIFVRDYENRIDDDEAREHFGRILTQRYGGEIREKQNTLVMLYPIREGIDGMIDKARTVAGIQAAESDERIKLDTGNAKRLKSRMDDAEGDLETVCMEVYSKMIYPKGTDLRINEISAMEAKQADLTSIILRLLKENGKLLEDPTYDVIELDKVTSLEKILESFRMDKSRHFILENNKIFDAISDGIREGAFGYAVNLVRSGEKYEGLIGQTPGTLSWSAFVIPKNMLVEQPDGPRPPPPPPPPPKPNFKYVIKTADIAKTEYAISVLTVIGNDMVESNMLETNLDHNGTRVSVKSELNSLTDIQSLLSTMKSRHYDGSGTLRITSQVDLSGEFKKNDQEYEVE